MKASNILLLGVVCVAFAACRKRTIAPAGEAPTQAPFDIADSSIVSATGTQSDDAAGGPHPSASLGEALLQVIAAGHPKSDEEVARLLRAGAPANYGSGTNTPINLAAYNNDLDIVRLLVAAGATLNFPSRAPQEESTLELAIRSPYGEPLELVRFLVAHGAHVRSRTKPSCSTGLPFATRCLCRRVRRGEAKLEESLKVNQGKSSLCAAFSSPC
jgi:ankyrin repeat protein